MKLEDLVQKLEGTFFIPNSYKGKNIKEITVQKVSPLDQAGPNDISFFINPKLLDQFKETKAGAVLVAKANEEINCVQIVHPEPKISMAKVYNLFYELKHSFTGLSELAFIHQHSKVHPKATVYPYCYISEGAEVGEDAVLYPNTFLGERAKVGKKSVLFPNVVLMADCEVGNNCLIHPGTAIGGDGFGFTPTGTQNIKVPQTGNVVIDDDVEIGSLCTIDRAAFDKTFIGKGSKLDSQVHVAHNVNIGELALIAGQTGIAGSAKIGKNFMSSGQVAIGPGMEIGDEVVIGPKAGVIRPIKEKGEYMGMPASSKIDWIKEVRSISKVPELIKRIRALEKKIEEMEKKNESLS